MTRIRIRIIRLIRLIFLKVLSYQFHHMWLKVQRRECILIRLALHLMLLKWQFCLLQQHSSFWLVCNVDPRTIPLSLPGSVFSTSVSSPPLNVSVCLLLRACSSTRPRVICCSRIITRPCCMTASCLLALPSLTTLAPRMPSSASSPPQRTTPPSSSIRPMHSCCR